jgi:hypothetical protein
MHGSHDDARIRNRNGKAKGQTWEEAREAREARKATKAHARHKKQARGLRSIEEPDLDGTEGGA